MQLCNYIQDELAGLLQQVQATPPKRYTSLKRIQSIVQSTALLDQQQKRALTQSIEKIQNTIRHFSTPQKKANNSTFNPMARQLTFEMQSNKRTIKELLNKKINRKTEKKIPIEQLEESYKALRQQRANLEEYLQQLVVKVQKLERVKQNCQKYEEKTRAKSAVDKELLRRMEKMKHINGSLSQSLIRHR